MRSEAVYIGFMEMKKKNVALTYTKHLTVQSMTKIRTSNFPVIIL